MLEPPADALVHRLKYGGWRELAPLLARRMARVRLPGDVDAEARRIVPVPTTTKRLRRRGYNQAEVLGRAYARETGRRVITALVRRGEGGTQVSLQPSERRANVADAFTLAAGSRRDVRGRHVLLVDDVLTTGATALAAAGTLVSGGCRRVSVVTFARALPGRSD